MDKSFNAEKTKQINIRLTEWEYEELKNAANYSKLNISHWIRAVLHEIFDYYESEESG